jgi:hypothetical protein
MKHIIGGKILDTEPLIEVAYSNAKEYPTGTHFPGGSGPRPVPLVVKTMLYRHDRGEFYAMQVAPDGRSALMKWNDRLVILWLFYETFTDTMHISPELFRWVRENLEGDWILECWERLVDRELCVNKNSALNQSEDQ